MRINLEDSMHNKTTRIVTAVVTVMLLVSVVGVAVSAVADQKCPAVTDSFDRYLNIPDLPEYSKDAVITTNENEEITLELSEEIIVIHVDGEDAGLFIDDVTLHSGAALILELPEYSYKIGFGEPESIVLDGGILFLQTASSGSEEGDPSGESIATHTKGTGTIYLDSGHTKASGLAFLYRMISGGITGNLVFGETQEILSLEIDELSVEIYSMGDGVSVIRIGSKEISLFGKNISSNSLVFCVPKSGYLDMTVNFSDESACSNIVVFYDADDEETVNVNISGISSDFVPVDYDAFLNPSLESDPVSVSLSNDNKVSTDESDPHLSSDENEGSTDESDSYLSSDENEGLTDESDPHLSSDENEGLTDESDSYSSSNDSVHDESDEQNTESDSSSEQNNATESSDDSETQETETTQNQGESQISVYEVTFTLDYLSVQNVEGNNLRLSSKDLLDQGQTITIKIDSSESVSGLLFRKEGEYLWNSSLGDITPFSSSSSEYILSFPANADYDNIVGVWEVSLSFDSDARLFDSLQDTCLGIIVIEGDNSPDLEDSASAHEEYIEQELSREEMQDMYSAESGSADSDTGIPVVSVISELAAVCVSLLLFQRF